MYESLRTSKRSVKWREQFVRERGNASFEDCVVNEGCVRKNELVRWCSSQTEFLCGFHGDCVRPVEDKAFERIITNLLSPNIFISTVEDWTDTRKLLVKIFPRFFENLSEKVTFQDKYSDHTLTQAQEKALEKICRVDNKLYNFVIDLTKELKLTCL